MRLFHLLLFTLPFFVFAQELSLEQDISPTIKALQEEEFAAMKNEDWKAMATVRDRLHETVTSSTVQPVNLEDRHGEIWNLGVLNQPFVVHGVTNWASRLNDMKIAAANVVADENATELMTFLLMPEPRNAADSQRLASVSENIIVVFMEVTKVKERKPGDTRLLSLFNAFPVTYYIRPDRRIAGVKLGARAPNAKKGNVAETTYEQAHASNLKTLRKDVKKLLRGKKIKPR